MYKHLELHNHSTESDSASTLEEVLGIMQELGADAFAITDHNTISGVGKLQTMVAQDATLPQVIPGMEYTTCYGHILCFGFTGYIPFTLPGRDNPEEIFHLGHEKDAVCGIAHPCANTLPVSTSGFRMRLSDFSCVDFMEIANGEATTAMNEQAIAWWEDLIFAGERIAITAGLDHHGRSPYQGKLATYIQGEADVDVAVELKQAIRTQQVFVSRGVLLLWKEIEGGVQFSLHHAGTATPAQQYVITLTTATGKTVYAIRWGESIDVLWRDIDSPMIAKLYESILDFEHLVCVSPVIYRK